MSKVTSTDYPTFTSGNVSINGTPSATASLSNGSINSNYNMTEAEKAIYDYAQNTLAAILPQLNTFSPETKNSLNAQLSAFQNQGVNAINDIYNPMLKSLQNDIASRFGNLDNSMFMDGLNNIESKRSDAVSSFAQDVLSRQSDLENAELNKRYAYADFLNNLQNQTLQNALKVISTALGSSSDANSYNNNLYNSLYKQYLQSQSGAGNITNTLANAVGLLSGGKTFL